MDKAQAARNRFQGEREAISRPKMQRGKKKIIRNKERGREGRW